MRVSVLVRRVPVALGLALALALALALVVALAAGCGPSGAGLGDGPATRPAGPAAPADPTLAPAAATRPAGAPLHVLFLLADGAGPAHLDYARSVRLAAGEPDLVLLGQIAPAAVASLVATANHAGGVTDSAASATALATGWATANALCGLGPGRERLVTILEALSPSVWRRGIVTDAAVVDASPAAFAAHASRKAYDSIAAQLAAARLDVLFGHGARFFLPPAAGGARADGRDLLAELRAAGVTTVTDAAALPSIARLPAVALVEATYGPGPASAAALLERALRLLVPAGGPDPAFFLFAETEAIDSAAHRNDAAALKGAVTAFDALAAAGLVFFRAHADHTLLVITSDHETGGFSFPGGVPAFTTSGHTHTPVPVWAMGPGSERFAGLGHHTEIGRALFELLTGAPPPPPGAPVP